MAMNNYYNPNPQQQFFPQPQGNVYLINNSLEVANVPISGGLSVAICSNEGLLYLKAMQNGNPMFQAYTLTPYEPKQNSQPNQQGLESLAQSIQKIEERLSKIETQSTEKGGLLNDI